MIPIIAAIQAWKYFKYLKFLPLFLCLAAGFVLAWWIQGIRVEKLQIQNSKFKTEITGCQKVNKTNQETITSLKKEITDTNTLCISRLKVKDKVINRLKYIDGLKPVVIPAASGIVQKDSESRSIGRMTNKKEGNEKNNIVDNADAILHELNGMFIKTNN